jgi:hypothetical protein
MGAILKISKIKSQKSKMFGFIRGIRMYSQFRIALAKILPALRENPQLNLCILLSGGALTEIY